MLGALGDGLAFSRQPRVVCEAPWTWMHESAWPAECGWRSQQAAWQWPQSDQPAALTERSCRHDSAGVVWLRQAPVPGAALNLTPAAGHGVGHASLHAAQPMADTCGVARRARTTAPLCRAPRRWRSSALPCALTPGTSRPRSRTGAGPGPAGPAAAAAPAGPVAAAESAQHAAAII